MFDSISRSWQLVRYSWAFLSRNKSFLLFPLLSSAASILATIFLLLPAGVFFGLLGLIDAGDGASILGYVFLFLYYVVLYTISIFFNVGLAGTILKELDGEEATVQDGLAIARGRLSLIVQYALLSATVGVILSVIRERGGVLGSLAAGLFGMAWNLVTFFVVPLLVLENKGILDIVRDSGSLLKRTFGEQVAGGIGIGLVTSLIGAGIVLLGVLLMVVFQSAAMIGLLVALVVLALLLLGLVSGALSSVYRVLVFRYAQSGVVPDDMDIALLQGAFKEKSKR